MAKTNKRKKKKVTITKKQKIALISLSIILVVLVILVGYKVYTKYLTKDKTETIKPAENKEIELDNYDYYLNGNATEYEQELAEELKKILSNEEINWDEYAKTLTKMFISDLFTLENKRSSSDITSSQYVYPAYQETFKLKVKDTIYSSIEIDLDNTRKQTLPSVTEVEISKVTHGKFKYNGKIIDNNAYFISANIKYAKDLGYPTNYNLVLVKNEDSLQVVKTN